MFITALVLSLGGTLALCTVAIYIKWVIANVGATIFTMLLMLLTMIFLLVFEEKEHEK